jgi:hypothetical protein
MKNDIMKYTYIMMCADTYIISYSECISLSRDENQFNMMCILFRGAWLLS